MNVVHALKKNYHLTTPGSVIWSKQLIMLVLIQPVKRLSNSQDSVLAKAVCMYGVGGEDFREEGRGVFCCCISK